ncbi:MAG: proline dehydrogenase family protein [Gemmatimonadales bacterium]
MSLLRSLLIKGSESAALARLMRDRAFARRAVRRFMPGETLDAALDAAAGQAALGIATTLTYLGEKVTDAANTEAVARHYVEALERVQARALPCEFSLKLTHLGLDLGRDVCIGMLERICAKAAGTGAFVWIDMEGTPHTDATLEVFRAVRARHGNLGLCVQAYLRRTAVDVEALIPLGAALRIVKGAYREPPTLVFRTKREVAEAFFRLGARLLAPDARRAGVRAVFGTHDVRLLARLEAHAHGLGLPPGAFECHMLYGIRTADQRRLAAHGVPVRVLISYGESWFAWYMRRLAERPANLWFVVRSVFA